MIERRLIYKCLPFALVAMTLVVTGCPHNDYTIQLNPHGNVIERILVFYCTDGANTNNGTPNSHAIDAKELAAITVLYPPNSLTNAGGRYSVRGEFTSEMPNDVGGAGVYTNLANSLGHAGFYVERFRGNDDLAGMSEREFKAADQLADLIIGWSQTELVGNLAMNSSINSSMWIFDTILRTSVRIGGKERLSTATKPMRARNSPFDLANTSLNGAISRSEKFLTCSKTLITCKHNCNGYNGWWRAKWECLTLNPCHHRSPSLPMKLRWENRSLIISPIQVLTGPN